MAAWRVAAPALSQQNCAVEMPLRKDDPPLIL